MAVTFDRNSFKAARKKAAGFKEYMYQRGCCSVSDHNEIRVPDLNKRKELKLALDTLELDSAQHSSLPQHSDIHQEPCATIGCR